jgi:predicted secreted hydrolase
MRFIILLIAALSTGCDRPPADQRQASASIGVDQRMGAEPDPGFARALKPRAFVFPHDHGAHPEYATEWWYFTGNLRATDGRRFGYQLTLFRVGLTPGPPLPDSDWRAHQLFMGHLAISDITNRRHHSSERFSRAAAGLAGAQVEPFRVWLGPWSISGNNKGPFFPLQLRAATPDIAIALTVDAGAKPIVLQGDQGLSRKAAAPGNASYYYSFTRLPTSGEIRLGDRRFQVGGDSWFDREWSSSALAADQAGWDWFALQLDDGRDLMFYRMRGKDGKAQRFSTGVLLEADGSAHRLTLDDVTPTPVRNWTSDEGVSYPVGWRLVLPGYGLDLQVDAAFDDQEMTHRVRYWEGAVAVTGSHTGAGYLELSGYAN